MVLDGIDAEVILELHELSITGRVVDATDGRGVGGAALSLSPSGPQDQLFFSVSGFGAAPESGADGVYRLEGIAPGTWQVRAVKEGYAAGSIEVQVTEGGDLFGIDIELEPARGVVFQVTTETGQPAHEVQVAALDAAERVVLEGEYGASEGGLVRLDELPTGRWTLLVATPGGATVALPVTAPAQSTIPVRLPPAGNLRINVPEIEGTGNPLDARLIGPSGQPCRQVSRGQVRSKWSFLDGVGLLRQIPAGPWTPRDQHAYGSRSWTQPVQVLFGTTADVSLR